MSPKAKKAIIQQSHPEISIRQKCMMFRLNRSSFYSTPVGDSEATLLLKSSINRIFTQNPFLGSRQMMAHLRAEDENLIVGRHRVSRLMALMGLKVIYKHSK